MEEEKKEVPIWIGIVGLILIITCIIFDCNELKISIETNMSVLGSLDYVCTMLTLLFAALYFMMGFKKDAAPYYKLFAWMFAISTCVFVLAVRTMPIVFVIIGLINYAILSILAVAKDLGKKKSFILCIISIVVSAAAIVLFCILNAGSVITMASKLLLSVLLFVMVNAKYADKGIRGTK